MATSPLERLRAEIEHLRGFTHGDSEVAEMVAASLDRMDDAVNEMERGLHPEGDRRRLERDGTQRG